MRRGPGVWREKKDGIWQEWHLVRDFAALQDARSRKTIAPGDIGLVENTELLARFQTGSRSASDSVELAVSCSTIFAAICPPAEEDEQGQMPRDDLDLLTVAGSEAKGVRARGKTKTGGEKKTSGKRPRWLLDKAIAEECGACATLDELFGRLRQREEFLSAKKDGEKRVNALGDRFSTVPWQAAQRAILEEAGKWTEKKEKADRKNAVEAAPYHRLLEADCLPLPGFQRPRDRLGITECKSEWNYAMWNMAGQRVRSHLGWVRRRSREQLLWHLGKKLFEEGGWIRTKDQGKAIKEKDRRPEHIVFSQPEDDLGDYQQRPAYRTRRWFRQLQGEYEGVEMPRLFAGLSFGARALPRISERMLKGWAKIRQKWRKVLTKRPNATAEELAGQVNLLRKRKPRDFGDQELFKWLARQDRRYLWDGSDRKVDNDCGRDDRDCVAAFAAYNERYAELPSSITFTENHPLRHPVWAFFGENSAVKYKLRCEEVADGEGRSQKTLYVLLDQLFCRNPDGKAYTAVSDVRVPLKGYRDFAESFDVSGGREIASTDELEFRDDLLAGDPLKAKLGGIKLIWDRGHFPKNAKKVPVRAPTRRVYVSFSCDVTEKQPPAWLAARGSEVAAISSQPRDGVKGLLELRRAIRWKEDVEGGKKNDSVLLLPNKRAWPDVAVQKKLKVLSVDLGQRHGAGTALWEVSAAETTDSLDWQIGQTRSGTCVRAALIDKGMISLPGDDEALPAAEEQLRNRLRRLRSRLNLQRMLLQVARLLSLEQFEKREFGKERKRHRRGGFDGPCGRRSVTRIEALKEDDIRGNCEKAAQLILNWASTDAMQESLRSLGHDGDLWSYLADKDPRLKNVANALPRTTVPSEKEARDSSLDRDSLKAQRGIEDKTFYDSVKQHRSALARTLCDGYDAALRKRATAGLWAELDHVLVREVSYSDQSEKEKPRELFTATGLLPLLRRPPAKKHDAVVDQNCLPLARTFRGGLSMQRLNFLEELKSFVRKWSCRPRWPGDVRRLSREQAFGVQDTRHLNHRREHRVKLVAHCIVARALGFEQDIRRGIWRYRDANTGELLWHHPESRRFFREREDGTLQQIGVPPGLTGQEKSHPHPVHPPAHLIVLENLWRYGFKRDRPSNENSGLMMWSHRQLLKFIKHIGGLFGLPLAVVYAAYSSRFCSSCGTPGFRASRFDPKWLDQEWMRRIRASNDIQDQAMKKVANEAKARLDEEPTAYEKVQDRPWIVREGGTHFVCANRHCPVHTEPIDADENAAANIGLRFLRGVEDFRTRVTPDGRLVKKLSYSTVERLDLVKSDGGDFWRQPSGERAETKSPRRKRPEQGAAAEEDLSEEDDEGSSIGVLRDPTGKALPSDDWYEEGVFWGHVARQVAAGIKAANADAFTPADENNDATA
jgi:transposase